jgi:hypothetical protein
MNHELLGFEFFFVLFIVGFDLCPLLLLLLKRSIKNNFFACSSL